MLAPSNVIDSPRAKVPIASKPVADPISLPPTTMDIPDLPTALSLGLAAVKLTLPRLIPLNSPGYDAEKSFGIDLIQTDGPFAIVSALNPNSELGMVERSRMSSLRKLPAGYTVVQLNGEFILGTSSDEMEKIVKHHSEETDSLELILAHPNNVAELLATQPTRFYDQFDDEEEEPDYDVDHIDQQIVMPEYDWRVLGKSESYVRQTTPDTVPLSEDAKATNFRDLDIVPFDRDWQKGGNLERQEIPVDVEAHSMSIASHDHRHFNGKTRLANDAETTTMEPLKPDTIPAGNTTLYLPNDLTGQTRLANDAETTTMESLKPDTIPAGNTTLYLPKDLTGQTRLENDQQTTTMEPLKPDTIPAGNTTLNMHRDLAGQTHMFNDRENSYMSRLSPDPTPSTLNAHTLVIRDEPHHMDTDWKISSNTRYEEIAVDASASIDQRGTYADTEHGSTNSQGKKWEQVNTPHPKTNQFIIKPEASSGSNALNLPRSITQGISLDMTASQPTAVYDHTETIKPKHPRDFEGTSPNSAWKASLSPTSNPIPLDTEASKGSDQLRNPRDIGTVDSIVEWKVGPIEHKDMVDAMPSSGNALMNNAREYDYNENCLNEWQSSGVTSTAQLIQPDTTASSGSIAMQNPRSFDQPDLGNWDNSQQGDLQDALDTEPSVGNALMNNSRDIDHLASSSEWKLGVQSTIERIGADNSASSGSIATKHAREYTEPEEGSWDPSTVAQTVTAINSEPSTGNSLMRNARDYGPAESGVEWTTGGVQHSDRDFVDSSASVNPDQYPRDHEAIDSLRDWKYPSTKPEGKEIAPDTIPSVPIKHTTSAFRTFESRGSDDWKNASQYPGDLATDVSAFTEPSSGSAVTQHARDYEGPEVSWKMGPSDPTSLSRSTDAVDVVAATAYPSFRQDSSLNDWSYSLRRQMSALHLAHDAVDIVVANAYPDFRDGVDLSNTDYFGAVDVNRSFIGTKAEKVKPLGSLQHDVYVDPSKIQSQLYNRGAPDPTKKHGGSLRYALKVESPIKPKQRFNRSVARVNTTRSPASSKAGVRPARMSSNMAAFLEGESQRRNRARTSPKSATNPLSSKTQKPKNNSNPSTSDHSPHPSPKVGLQQRILSDSTIAPTTARPFFRDCLIPGPSPKILSSPRKPKLDGQTRIPLPRGLKPDETLANSRHSARVSLTFAIDPTRNVNNDNNNDSNSDSDSDNNSSSDRLPPEKLTILPLTDEHTTIDISPNKHGEMEISRTSMLGLKSPSNQTVSPLPEPSVTTTTIMVDDVVATTTVMVDDTTTTIDTYDDDNNSVITSNTVSEVPADSSDDTNVAVVGNTNNTNNNTNNNNTNTTADEPVSVHARTARFEEHRFKEERPKPAMQTRFSVHFKPEDLPSPTIDVKSEPKSSFKTAV